MQTGTPTGNQTFIDPNKFSSEELLKMVYRDTQTINTKIDEIQKNYAEDKKTQDEKIAEHGVQIAQLRTVIAEKEKNFKNSLTIISIALSVLSGLSGIIGWLLKQI